MLLRRLWREERFFQELPFEYKYAYIYIFGESDEAGIWKVNVPQLLRDTGIPTFNIEDFIAKANNDYHIFTGATFKYERLKLHGEEYLVNREYLHYAHGDSEGKVDQSSAAVARAFDRLRAIGELEVVLDKRYIELANPTNFEVTAVPAKKIPPIPLKSGKDYYITQEYVDEIYRSYEEEIERLNIDVVGIFKQMRMWCIANPARRKTERGINRFIQSWFARQIENEKRTADNDDFMGLRV